MKRTVLKSLKTLRREIDMEDKESRNLCILLGLIMILMYVSSSIKNYNEEKTKQLEIELEILKYESGATNFVNSLE